MGRLNPSDGARDIVALIGAGKRHVGDESALGMGFGIEF